MSVTRLSILTIGMVTIGSLLLQGCATEPVLVEAEQPRAVESQDEVQSAQAIEQRPVPELMLNLPEDLTGSCDCDPPAEVDRTFLEKGFSSLAGGDYREAVNYFRRYERLESYPAAAWEAGIAVAYVKMLPASPYHNWRAARESWIRLMRVKPEGVALNEQVLVLQETLALLSNLHVRLDETQKERSELAETLEKREEALRRLRELMLGQKEDEP